MINKYILFIGLIFLSFLSMLPNLNTYPFVGEEATRAIVAFEMAHSKNYFQPTILGSEYFNKPPLFNWFIIFSSNFFGWDIITARAVTLFFTLANTVLVFFFSFLIFRNKEIALISSLIYITFSDILFWYGYLAEIDISLSFFANLLFLQVYLLYKTQKIFLYYSISLTTGILFMLKGFPAFAFLGFSMLTLVIFTKSLRPVLNIHASLSYALALIFSFWWIPLSDNPFFYLKRLWEESFSRVESSKDVFKFISHFISYPLLNIKQLLPSSAFVLGILAIKRLKIQLPEDIKFILALAGLNYIPYIISATSQGRYVIPLFPLMALAFSYIIKEFLSKRWFTIFLFILAVTISMRALYGIFILPVITEKKGEPKVIAKEIHTKTAEGTLTCDCFKVKDLCLYVGFLKGYPLIKSAYVKDWNFSIKCDTNIRNHKILAIYSYRGMKVYLIKRGENYP